jgi:phosphoglycolate phosphatase
MRSNDRETMRSHGRETMRRLQAAIVDLDGTMVDTLGDFELALNLMLADLGYAPVGRSFIECTVGKGSEHLVRSTLDYVRNRPLAQQNTAQTAIKNVVLDTAMQSYQAHYFAVNGQASHVYAGVVRGLEQLRTAGLQLACLTNKPGAFAVPLLKAKGLDGYFSHVFGGDAFARKKPDPLPLLKTCQALGTSPEHTLMIGDSSNDALAARAAGCPVALVTYGYNHGEPISAVDCDVRVDALSELPAWLHAT